MQIESEYLVADLISWNSITVEKEKRRRPMISEIHYEIRLKLTLSKYIYISEQETATHCSVLAWRVLWTEESGGLLSMGLHRFGHD